MCCGVHCASMRATCSLSSFINLSFYFFRIQTYGWETKVSSLHRLVNYDIGKSNEIGTGLLKIMNIPINIRTT